MELTQGCPFRFSLSGRLLAVMALILASCAMAMAQSTAALNGTVTDTTGATISDAKVLATNQATGVTTTSRSDRAGAYLFPALPIGTYRIEVSANGFQTAVLDGLKLEVAMTVTRNFELQVGQVSQQIDIAADAAVVETATTSVGQVINDKTVQEIPLNGAISPISVC